MSLQNTITKVIAVLKAAIMSDYTDCKGIYEGVQMAHSAYPVISVGVPYSFEERFPVISRLTVRDEEYTVEILAHVKYADTVASARQIITLTESIRTALRDDIKTNAGPLDGDCYQAELGKSEFFQISNGDILLRISVTTVKYIQRIA